jgi:Type ISP C-terminal specificity domain
LSAIDIDPTALASASELASHARQSFSLHRADVLREPILLELAESEPRVLVIAGNPPWAIARADKTPAMQALLEDFRCDERGERLPERKLGVLSDAYVRFFRVCAEAARRSEQGALLALITNGSFLDGPVHRGMRAALRRWFDALYVLDLGGSALLHRSGRDRLRDDNVFGVRPSVTISWLCRKPGRSDARAGRVLYARLWGDRDEKLQALASASVEDLGFQPLSLDPPLGRFVPRRAADAGYASWPSLAEWMPFHREGVQTNRDRLAVDLDRKALLARLRRFASGAELASLADLAHFSVAAARENVARALERDPSGELGIAVRQLAYRPFDVRWFSPIVPLCHRPRPELSRAIEHAPEVLVSVRKDRGSSPYTHFGAASFTIDNCFSSARSSCRSRAFPVRTPEGEDNLAPQLRDQLFGRTGRAVDASSFARYALAVLAADSFRRRFDAELHADYPRLPLPESAEHWDALVEIGSRLWSLWTSALEVAPLASADDAELRCSDVRIDLVRGVVLAGSERWIECDPALLGPWLGHHQPVRNYLLVRGPEPANQRHRAAVVALVDRMAGVRKTAAESDIWLGNQAACSSLK